MKRFCLVLILLIISIAPGTGLHASEEGAAAVVQTLFKFMQEGNTNAILELFTDPILAQKRDQLENSRAYSKFLIDTYAKSSMVISRVEHLSESETIVDVEFRFPNGDPPLKTRFVTNNHEGPWKIAFEKIIGQ